MKTRIHPTRIIAYLVQLALVIFLFWFLRSHFFLMLLAIMAVVPVLSLISVFILRSKVDVTLVAPEREQSFPRTLDGIRMSRADAASASFSR